MEQRASWILHSKQANKVDACAGLLVLLLLVCALPTVVWAKGASGGGRTSSASSGSSSRQDTQLAQLARAPGRPCLYPSLPSASASDVLPSASLPPAP